MAKVENEVFKDMDAVVAELSQYEGIVGWHYRYDVKGLAEAVTVKVPGGFAINKSKADVFKVIPKFLTYVGAMYHNNPLLLRADGWQLIGEKCSDAERFADGVANGDMVEKVYTADAELVVEFYEYGSLRVLTADLNTLEVSIDGFAV